MLIKDYSLKINKNQILARFFGDNGLDHLIEQMYDEIVASKVAEPQCIYEVKKTDHSILQKYLADYQYTIYVVITLGIKIDMEIERYFEKKEYVKALLLDEYANHLLWNIDKQTIELLSRLCKKNNMGLAQKLIPGEIIDLSTQKLIIDETNARKINVTYTQGYMLQPEKTITYIIGADQNLKNNNVKYGCKFCTLQSCDMRIIKKNYAVVVDLGTTTISLSLINMETKKTEKTFTFLNSQAKYGTDVITRIHNANNGKLKLLSDTVKEDIKSGIKSIIECSTDMFIDKIVIAANTTMIHMLTNTSCETLGLFPFTPKITNTIKTTYHLLFGDNMLDAEIIILPSLSAFIGSDVLAGIYYTNMYKKDSVSLLIDIGTNGEMALGNKDKIICSSAAAGPAFEGGNITCGVSYVTGAISSVEYRDNHFKYKTVQNSEPIGICGTGIVDAIAQSLDNNLIDNTGLILNGNDEIKIAEIKSGFIRLSQMDIREVQLAKSSIRTGLELLMSQLCIDYDQIESVYIAGSFGFQLNIENAIKIKLLPQQLKNKVKIIGNSSLEGSKKYLAEKDGLDIFDKIKKIMTEVNLPLINEFNNLFIKYLDF